MKKILSLAMLAVLSAAASAQTTFQLSATNPSTADRTDQPVVISLADKGFVASALVTLGKDTIPCQLDDLNQDEVFDELCFLVDLKGKEQKTYQMARALYQVNDIHLH